MRRKTSPYRKSSFACGLSYANVARQQWKHSSHWVKHRTHHFTVRHCGQAPAQDSDVLRGMSSTTCWHKKDICEAFTCEAFMRAVLSRTFLPITRVPKQALSCNFSSILFFLLCWHKNFAEHIPFVFSIMQICSQMLQEPVIKGKMPIRSELSHGK